MDKMKPGCVHGLIQIVTATAVHSARYPPDICSFRVRSFTSSKRGLGSSSPRYLLFQSPLDHLL